MCLTYIDSKTRVPKRKRGFKVFRKRDGLYYPLFFPYDVRTHSGLFGTGVGMEEGETYLDYNSDFISTGLGKSYPCGFHIFPTKSGGEVQFEASNFLNPLRSYDTSDMDSISLCEVEFDEVVASGEQFISSLGKGFDGQFPVVVAKKMKIIREISSRRRSA